MSDMARRPAVGTKGKRIQLTANFFEMKMPDITVQHYDVVMTPDVPPPVRRRVFEQFVTRHSASDLGNARPVFDGRSNLFSATALPFESRTFEVILPGDVRPNSQRPIPVFKVKVKKASTIDLEELGRFLEGRSSLTGNCQTAIMALDVLLHHQPAMLYATVGRSFFLPTDKQRLAGPVEAWHGYFQSVRPTSGRMMVNVDVSSTAFFRSGDLIDIVISILNLRSPASTGNESREPSKTLRISVRHRTSAPTRTFKIQKLSPTSAKETMFNRDTATTAGSGDTISIEGYFQQTYNMRLTYPLLPCVVIGPRLVLPMEVCMVVPAQRYTRKLDQAQVADMVKFATQKPHERLNNIKKGLEILAYDQNPFVGAFGVRIAKEMAMVRARILDAPMLSYSPRSVQANFASPEGAWNLINKKLIQGASLESWAVVVFVSERQLPREQVQGFVRELCQVCVDMGITIPNKSPQMVYMNPQGDIEQGLRAAWKMAGDQVKKYPQLLLCILPNTGTPLYAEIKRVTDTVLGSASQCMQSIHTRQPKKQYCANLCLKINAKLGGLNWRLATPFMTDKPTILFGADVNHARAGDMNTPSIAAVVASLDDHAGKFATSVRLQPNRTEVITDLKDMVHDLLKAYYTYCKKKPARILFYRDGVSEGEFPKILQTEVAAIRAACTSLSSDYHPPITFAVVQKRHHARFNPKREDADRSGNCKPGTVIDMDVVHPFEFDYYMYSHAGLLGTSRPAHYHVLLDENRLTSDVLQELTYKLCFLYARCTRSVSLVPPAYYAHLVAARARFHFKGEGIETSSTGEGGVDVSTYRAVHSKLHQGMSSFDSFCPF
ncbi:hypothetical protein BGZ70_003364 [Mortierella alpina]|uniref:Piwi domain-containing protein n=1 Tax=Mortierella alpina TaxID=64518 RepID=A0A9P6ISY0_MORAP|nr:hypothetical protein BGZ70_003364 [Mortierella alpina]